MEHNSLRPSEGTHVSVYLGLMKGPYDDELEQSGHWPLRGTFTIELLNQFNDNDHYSRMAQFHHYRRSECTNRSLKGNSTQYGYPQFISHDTILHHSNNSYHQSDCLIFRISYEDIQDPTFQIAPVTFTVTKFSQWLKSPKDWYSSPSFFVFEEGYQMYLQVIAANNDDGEGTHVSVYLRLINGPYDDKLEQTGNWPLTGTFSIELLNQLNNSNHYSRMMQFHRYQCIYCTDRALERDFEWGHSQFISHDTLLHHSNSSYYENDSLIFRITYDKMEAPCQVAPVTFKVTKFSHWLKSKRDWYNSSLFFAFKRGYQMYLKVNAAGYAKGKGTHVSVHLRLMKGPYDDKLEQSDHWPLRGRFTIELLNQLNDSDHYSRILQFHHYRCSKCTNRVLKRVEAKSGMGYQQFISHNTLLHHRNNSYHRNDCLIFRITYEDMETPYQVAPVIFKVTKFSHWLKSKANWYSSSFFAFEKGYLFYLKINPTGEAGTHVSVYLYLTKGPHDDKLEQSQLKGKITIELLNQLSDNDHHSSNVWFATVRSFNEEHMNDGIMIKAMDKYISHTTLFQRYLKNDTLTFRVSYYGI